MKIYLIYTHDAWKTRTSYVLRGITTSLRKAQNAVKALVKNKVEEKENISVVEVENNTMELDGGFLI